MRACVRVRATILPIYTGILFMFLSYPVSPFFMFGLDIAHIQAVALCFSGHQRLLIKIQNNRIAIVHKMLCMTFTANVNEKGGKGEREMEC